MIALAIVFSLLVLAYFIWSFISEREEFEIDLHDEKDPWTKVSRIKTIMGIIGMSVMIILLIAGSVVFDISILAW